MTQIDLGPGYQLPSYLLDANEASFDYVDDLTASASTDLITVAAGHGQTPDDLIIIIPGPTGGTMPAPLVAYHYYRVLATGWSTTQFKIGDNDLWVPGVGAPVIDLTTNGAARLMLWTSAFDIAAVILSVDTGTDTITTTYPHHFKADSRLRFINSGGALPAPLVAGTDYFVRSTGLTATAFRLATGGGAGTPVDLTTAGSGTNTIYWKGLAILGLYGLWGWETGDWHELREEDGGVTPVPSGAETWGILDA